MDPRHDASGSLNRTCHRHSSTPGDEARLSHGADHRDHTIGSFRRIGFSPRLDGVEHVDCRLPQRCGRGEVAVVGAHLELGLPVRKDQVALARAEGIGTGGVPDQSIR